MADIVVTELLWQVAIAIATGSLSGLERERRPQRKFAELRTMAILCGTGPIAVEIAVTEGYSLFVALYLTVAIGLAGIATLVLERALG